MKKTLALLLASATAAFADKVELGTPSTNANYQVYALEENFANGLNNTTIGVKIDMNAVRDRMAKDGMNDASCYYSDFDSFVTLQGFDSENYSVTQGLGFNAWDKELTLCGSKSYSPNTVDPNSYKYAYLEGISNLTLPWDSMQSLSLVLVSVENSPKDVLTCYISYVDGSGNVITVSGGDMAAPRDPYAFTMLNVNTAYVTDVELYDSGLSAEDAAALSVSMLGMDSSDEPSEDDTTGGGNDSSETVPEPATATLSLLALAALVARRRRK